MFCCNGWKCWRFNVSASSRVWVLVCRNTAEARSVIHLRPGQSSTRCRPSQRSVDLQGLGRASVRARTRRNASCTMALVTAACRTYAAYGLPRSWRHKAARCRTLRETRRGRMAHQNAWSRTACPLGTALTLRDTQYRGYYGYTLNFGVEKRSTSLQNDLFEHNTKV